MEFICPKFNDGGNAQFIDDGWNKIFYSILGYHPNDELFNVSINFEKKRRKVNPNRILRSLLLSILRSTLIFPDKKQSQYILTGSYLKKFSDIVKLRIYLGSFVLNQILKILIHTN